MNGAAPSQKRCLALESYYGLGAHRFCLEAWNDDSGGSFQVS